eukprot:12393372-Karenia_brevis.AAC.1
MVRTEEEISLPDSRVEEDQGKKSVLLNESLDLSGDSIHGFSMAAEPVDPDQRSPRFLSSSSDEELARMMEIFFRSMLGQPAQT